MPLFTYVWNKPKTLHSSVLDDIFHLLIEGAVAEWLSVAFTTQSVAFPTQRSRVRILLLPISMLITSAFAKVVANTW